MTIIEFGKEHVEAARLIASRALERERAAVPELPEVAPLVDFENLHGVAATEGGELVSYMCAYPPRAGFFGTDVAGSGLLCMRTGSLILKDSTAGKSFRSFTELAVKNGVLWALDTTA